MVDIDNSFLQRLEPAGVAQLASDKLDQIKSVAREFQMKTGHVALVVGASSSQQTMTASLLGKDTNRDVYRVDLAGVISKYIGETEKNLSKVFELAEKLEAVLFFDEADALFGKRTDVKDAHDRFANLEVGYLLERVENYSGLSILATNLRSDLDDAVLPHMTWVIDFSEVLALPRLSLWGRIFRWFSGFR